MFKIGSFFRLTACAALVASAVLFSSCGNGGETYIKSSKDDAAVVMTVDGYDVRREVFEYFYVNYAGQLGEDSSLLKEYVMDSLFELYAGLSLAEEYGITPDDSAVKDRVDSMFDEYAAGYASADDFIADMEQMHINDSVLRLILEAMECSDQVYYKLINEGIIPSDEGEIRDIINSDELIRIKQIFIEKTSDGNDAEKLELAESLHARAVGGEDFAALIDEYGNDWQMFSNPDGVYITKYQNIPEFSDAAFALNINEISGVVETYKGYSIILRLEKEEDYINKHFDDLYDNIQTARFNEMIARIKNELKLKTDEKDAFLIYNPLSFTDAE